VLQLFSQGTSSLLCCSYSAKTIDIHSKIFLIGKVLLLCCMLGLTLPGK